MAIRPFYRTLLFLPRFGCSDSLLPRAILLGEWFYGAAAVVMVGDVVAQRNLSLSESSCIHALYQLNLFPQ